MRYLPTRFLYLGLLALPLFGCSNGDDNDNSVTTPPNEASVYEVANGCYSISPDGGQKFLSTGDGDITQVL